jgi:hypothetical protein
MQKRQGVAEILKLISQIRELKDRQDSLATCVGIQPVIAVLKFMFDPRIKFLLPEGEPPYKKTEKSMDLQGTLYREAKKLNYFVEGPYPNLRQVKREQLFIELLEAVDPDDAELLIAMKDKKSPYITINYELVWKTFPGLLPDPEEYGVYIGGEKRKKATPCPFGCRSSNEDGLFMAGPLRMHLRKAHGPEAEIQHLGEPKNSDDETGDDEDEE